jgi:flagellar basal-body rod modification protein FlgD
MALNTLSSANLLGVTSYEEQAKNKTNSRNGEDMGKQDFLTLFTAQLKNQDPLDPVKNEAFVAQLAQFSQLEALTNMQTSLDSFVASMSNERMLSSTNLIGKKVAVAGGFAQLSESGTLNGSIDLPQGASGVRVNVYDAKGSLVQELVAGAQSPGTIPIQWDGKDAMGNPVPAGLYRFTAQAVVNGANTDVPVNTLSTVRTVLNSATDGAITLELEGGKSVLLSAVQRVGL